ncbi:unnamed protein product, partial [Mesorhabditis spiculigera]
MDPNRIYLPPPTTVGRFHFLFAQDAQTDGYFLESQIKKVCEENGAVLKGYSDRVVKQDFNGCKDTEVYADIEHPEWQIAFSDIILDLGLLWPDLEANFHLAATIEIPSATVFCRQLGPPLDFPAEAIYYGNFANRGQLLLHWEVSYRSNGERLKEGIKCSFVHDEGMAYFRFQNWEKSNDCDRNLESHLQWIEGRKDGKSCLMTYTIRLPYKNVKRLFVEQTADGTYLHFHTMVPPEIFRISEQRQKKAGRQGDGERTRYIFRGRTEGELPKSTTLCESPIFSVEISHEKMSDDTLYQLLGRMSQIGCMPIFYTLLDHKYELVAYRDDLGGIKEIQKIVEDSLEGDNEVNIELDPAFNHPGWENMKEEAEAGLIEWSQAIKRVLDHYGVASAAEIITGCVMAMRNKAAESDGDQVTYFTTSQTIESTGHHIGDYEMLTEPYEEHWANEAHPLHRQVKQPTVAMLQKATAYYKVAYEYARQQRGDRTLYLSFPWLVWDLLVALKKDRFRHDMEAVYEETQAKEFNVV